MLTVHPIIQCLASLLAAYVMYMGVQRFGYLHLKKRTVFRWRRHVTLGYISLGTWLVGTVFGFAVVYVHWHGFLITGTHATIALVMVPFLILGLVSGARMDRNKRKRKALPLIHGVSNLLALLLALVQVVSGWWVYKVFILGG